MSEKEILVTGHKNPDTDSICSALAYANLKNQMGIKARAICAGPANKETTFALNYFGVEAPEIVTAFAPVAEGEAKQKVILVDHNEKVQIIDGIENCEIFENIDHHRIGGLVTENPIFIHYEPVGCTSTILANLYWQHEQPIPKAFAGLMLSAIISDTVLFRSPTCTEKDKATAHKLAEIAGVNLEEYGMAMLKAGADLGDFSDEQLAKNDMKEFSAEGKVISIGQVQVMDTTDILARKEGILKALESLRAEKNYSASYLMVTSILEESTNLIYSGDADEVVEKAFAQKPENNEVFLANTMSRKKQIVPPVLSAMK